MRTSERSITQRFCASAHAQFWRKHGDGGLRKVLNSAYISTKSRRLVDISTLILFSSARYDISRCLRWHRRAFLKTRYDNLGVYFAWCSVLLAIIHVVICEVSGSGRGCSNNAQLCCFSPVLVVLLMMCMIRVVCRHRFISAVNQAFVNTRIFTLSISDALFICRVYIYFLRYYISIIRLLPISQFIKTDSIYKVYAKIKYLSSTMYFVGQGTMFFLTCIMLLFELFINSM